MKKSKQKFIVYWNTSIGWGMYSERYNMGETFAVSEAQAINNVRYRTRDEDKVILTSPGFTSHGWWTAEPALNKWNSKWKDARSVEEK